MKESDKAGYGSMASSGLILVLTYWTHRSVSDQYLSGLEAEELLSKGEPYLALRLVQVTSRWEGYGGVVVL